MQLLNRFVLALLTVVLNMCYGMPSYSNMGVFKRSLSTQSIMNKWAGVMRPNMFMDVRNDDYLSDMLDQFRSEQD
ncbi:unnamed protein product [Bursaphelenchus okinawaensis]|uniref:Uncharacterized protein n=1 Tax=Bursaphelenchus okinawaensis TaxID=465554 RepID=A0A811LUV7_9BILA|nr:unnamed protein product [Bursaphelenchus okinawaensis]CAG9128006.1 unnamed protein product [Bursaphelenchus okinawaensis]